MRGAWLTAALWLCGAGCRTLPPPQGDPHRSADAHVEAVALAFPHEAEGTLTLDLAVPGRPDDDGSLSLVEWELWVEGRAVASGLVQLEQPLPKGAWTKVHLELPLLFRHLGWTPETRELAVRVTGQVARRYGLDLLRTGFDHRSRVLSVGAVVFER